MLDQMDDFDIEDNNILRQLKFFYKMDKEKEFSKEILYVKAYYLHHLLDYFRETRYDIKDLDLIFKNFLENKVISEFNDKEGNLIDFSKLIEEIFQLLRKNSKELYNDLKGDYLLGSEKDEKI